MVADTLDSLAELPEARERVRAALRPADRRHLAAKESLIRQQLDPREAYNDVPGRDPHFC